MADEASSDFEVGTGFTSLKIKTTEAPRVRKMIDYSFKMMPTTARYYLGKYEELLDSYDFSEIDTTKETDIAPLLIASSVGFRTFLEKWKSHGLSFDVVDSKGNTPLHYVIKNPWYATDLLTTVQFLLQSGVDANARNKSGRTPLHFIGQFFEGNTDIGCSVKIMEELVNAGGDLNLSGRFPFTPLVSTIFSSENKSHLRLEDMLNFGADPIFKAGLDEMCVLDIFYPVFDRFLIMDPGNDSSNIQTTLQKTEKVVFHLLRLKVLGFQLSDIVDSSIERMLLLIALIKERHPTVNINGRDYLSENAVGNFQKKCEREKEKMKSLKLDRVNSLYDLAIKSVPELWRFTYKDVFQEYFSSKEYRREFPIYWFILRLQFKAVEERKKILPKALDILEACNLPLYDVCLEHILNQLTNKELNEFIRINECIPHASSQIEDDEEDKFIDYDKLYSRDYKRLLYIV